MNNLRVSHRGQLFAAACTFRAMLIVGSLVIDAVGANGALALVLALALLAFVTATPAMVSRKDPSWSHPASGLTLPL